MLVINDTNYQQFIGDGRTVHAGGEPRHLSLVASPYKRGEQPGAVRFCDSSIDAGLGFGVALTEQQCLERAKHLEETEARISDHIDFDAWDQNGLPYCWNNAGTQAASTLRRMMGLPFVHFSAASVGCIASGYRVRGGYGGETLKVLKEVGAVDAKDWGNNAIDRALDTSATQENRKHHKVIEFVECETWLEVMTCLVLGFPTSNDYGWWSHVAEGCDILPNGDLRIRNSWSENWGDKNKHGKGGFAILSGRKKMPDYCFAVRQVTASEI